MCACCVVAFGGSSSSIFVHTKSNSLLADMPPRIPRTSPNGL